MASEDLQIFKVQQVEFIKNHLIMATYSISGIPVKFPFEPYAVQTAYMSKVIESLNSSTNAGKLI